MIGDRLDPTLRIGFITGRYLDPGPPPRVDVGLGRLVETLVASYPRLHLLANRVEGTWGMIFHELAIPSSNYSVLPTMRRTREGIAVTPAVFRRLRALNREIDAAIVQLPFPAPLALAAIDKPTVFHVCLDPLEVARCAPHYSGATRPLALAAGHTLVAWYRRLIDRPNARVLANGAALLDRYSSGHGRAVVSTTLVDDDIASVARSRPESAPFQVLFVGQLRPEKGIDLLIDGFEALRKAIPNLELVVVGDLAASGNSWARNLRARAELLGGEAIHFTGAVPWGPELFQRFVDADVFALPSRAEGTPRVLMEARAFGCPVVATRVGGVSESVRHEVDGLIVEPGSRHALVDAVIRIHDDHELRSRLRDNGYATARAHTINQFAEAMTAELWEAISAGRS